MATHIQPSLPHTEPTPFSPTEQTQQETLHDLTRLDRPRTVRPTTELIFHGLQTVVSLYSLLTILRTIHYQTSQSYFSGTAWFLLLACYASLHLAISYLILAWWSRQPSFQDEVAATIQERDLARQQAQPSSSDQLSPPPPPAIRRSKVMQFSAFLLSPRSRVWILISLFGFTLLASILQAYKIRQGTNCAIYVDVLRQFCLTTRRAVSSSFVESVLWLGWLLFWFLVSFYKRTGDGGLKQEYNATTGWTWVGESTTRILKRAKEFANKQRNRVAPQTGREDARVSGHIPHDSFPMQEKTLDSDNERYLQNISIHPLEQQQHQQQQQQQQKPWQDPDDADHRAEIRSALQLTTSQASSRIYQAPQERERQHPLNIGPPVPPKDSKGKGVIPGGMGSTGQLPALPNETLSVSTTHVADTAESVVAGISHGIQTAGEEPANDAPWSPVADHSTRLRDHAKIFPRPRSSNNLKLTRRASRDSINTVSSISTQATQMSKGEIGYMGNRTLKDLRSSNGNLLTPRSHSMCNIAAYTSIVPPKGSVEDERQLDEKLRAIRRRSLSNNSMNETWSTKEMFRPEVVSSFTRNSVGSLRTSASSPALGVIRKSSQGLKNVIATLVSTPNPLSDSGSSSFSSYTSDGSTSSLEEPPTATGEMSRYQIQSQGAFVTLSPSLGQDSLGYSSSFTPEDEKSQQRYQPQPFVLSLDTKGAFRPRTKSISSSRSANSMATLGQSPSLPSQSDPSSTAASAAATGVVMAAAKEDEASFPTLTKANQARLSKYRSGELAYPPPPPISPTGTSFSRTSFESKNLVSKVENNSDVTDRSARMQDDENVGFRKQLNKNTKARVPSFEVLKSKVST